MLYNFQRKKMCRHLLFGGALLAAGLSIYSCSDDYTLGDDQPTGLSTIYGYMEEQGGFTNYLHLIDDLGLKEVLSKTGSKTMFIADDEAFAKFYESNTWGVKKYSDLSLAQKKLLLNSSMIDNPYSTHMLSSAESQGSSGRPVKGEVCRRSSSQSLYDSVMVVTAASASSVLPNNPLFNEVKANHDSIVLFTDASNAAPMVHFTGKFIVTNKLANSDVDFIYNQPEGTFKSDDIYVNQSRVINSNIFCLNGFIHQVDKVITPLENMAEIIRTTPEASIYSSIIERFAAPDDSVSLSKVYNGVYGTTYDTVFVKRYFSDRSDGSTMSTNKPFNLDKNGKPFDDGNTALKYDPGWNGYLPYISNDRQPMMEDLAVMLVPTDEAINEWWNNGGGAVVKNYYGTIEATPNSVLDKLVRVNQLESFVSSAPSRFADVMDDANEKLGITTQDVDRSIIGCNGIVLLTNKVFTPSSYSSVLFPAVIDTTQFKILSNVITNLNYDKYLNSPVSSYVFLLPTNKGMLTYIDPVSYGQSQGTQPNRANLWEFHLDLTKQSSKQLYADVYECNILENGEIELLDKKTTITGGTDNSVLKNRIEDLLDNHIVVLDENEVYDPAKKYYKTKARTFVKLESDGNQYKVYGSYQNETNQPIVADASATYNMKNGITIPIEGVAMGARRSVLGTLKSTTDENGDTIFSEFASILEVCAVSKNNSKDKWQAGDQVYGNLFNLKNKGALGAEDVTSNTGKATYLLNNYNYTVYAPTNDAMHKAYEAGLPDLDSLERAELYDDQNDLDPSTDPGSHTAAVLEVMLDFVKYHIQDNSIFVDKGFTGGYYESGKTELIKAVVVDEETGETSWNGKYSPGRPYKLNVKVSADGMTVTDCRNGYDSNGNPLGGVTAIVVTKPGCYNLMAREYWYNSGSNITTPYTVNLNNSSSVVIQGIDSPLIYADGKHYDSNGLLIPTQFEYTYKPLSDNK